MYVEIDPSPNDIDPATLSDRELASKIKTGLTAVAKAFLRSLTV